MTNCNRKHLEKKEHRRGQGSATATSIKSIKITLTDSSHSFTSAAEAQGLFSSNVYSLLHRYRASLSLSSSTHAFASHVRTRHQLLRKWRGIRSSINRGDDKHRRRGEGGRRGATVHRDLRRTLVARPRNVCVPLAIPGTEYNQRMAATWQRIGTKAVLMGSNRICGSFDPEKLNTTGTATQPASHTRPIQPWGLSLYCVS